MVQKFKAFLVAFFLIGFSLSCKQQQAEISGVQIAFMADVHLSDIYGEFEDTDYKGVLNPANQKYVHVRTMKSQLHSTRIFNENYFAFRAALDDVVNRNIKYVVLPGDFSDDGQPYNIRGIHHILEAYSTTYGIQFFAITGNHDPVGPYEMEGGKADFLGEDGKPQAIMSEEGLYSPLSQDENPVVVTKDIRKMGYEEIVNALGRYGFLPQENYKYWETPFSTYHYEDYSFEQALAQSSLSHRSYAVDGSNKKLPDVSYLVEPEEGLWLMGLDGNVFLPSGEGEADFKKAPLKRGGEYANIIAYKEYLIKWVGDVVKESKRLNKTLITFSHYPMVDFYDGAAQDLKSLFGEEKWQLHRVPDEHIAELFAEAGLRLHFGGHMHLNDTGLRNFGEGSFLGNIQVPALAGYPAAYKVLSINSPDEMEIETVQLDSVPGFDEFFQLYEREYAYLNSIDNEGVWDKGILSSKSYEELIDGHLKELVRLRFLEKDWPEDFRNFMLNLNGRSLLHLAGASELDSIKYVDWSGLDMIFDFYRLLSADQLALEDIGVDRLEQYHTIIRAELSKSPSDNVDVDPLKADFHLFIKIFNSLLISEPSDHFMIDMKKGELFDLEKDFL
jgi:3',5'-cyclic AMP phosphodiesterase CpdA